VQGSSKVVIKSINEEAIEINGVLVKFGLLRHYYETHSWAAHSPNQTLYAVLGQMQTLSNGIMTPDEDFAFRLLWRLAMLHNQGFPVSHDIFRFSQKGPYGLFITDKFTSAVNHVILSKTMSGFMWDRVSEEWTGNCPVEYK